MKYGRKFIAVIFLFLLQSCTTSYHAVADKKTVLVAHEPSSEILSLPVYVKNPELAYEYTIFKKSGRFTEVGEKEAKAVITLNRFESMPTCGNPLIVSMFTLGTIPVSLPYGGIYSFTAQSREQSQTYKFWLESEERTSIWEWIFKPFSSQEKALGESLKSAKPSSITTQSNKSLDSDALRGST